MMISLKARAADSCDKCAAIETLEAEFNKLDYSDMDDRHKGAERLDDVFPYFSDLENKKKLTASEKARFLALVKLSAAALPYDVETSLAAEIDSVMYKNPALKADFQKALNNVADTCRRKLLADAVEEQGCVANQMAAGKYEKAGVKSRAKSCTKENGFDFDKCLENVNKK
jgi:hypothetical protein